MKQKWLPVAAKWIGFLLTCAITCVNFSAPMREVAALPDTVHVLPEAPSLLPETGHWLFGGTGAAPVSMPGDETISDFGTTQVTYRLFGVLPLRTVAVNKCNSVLLVPGGDAVGITIRTEGVLIVGLDEVETLTGFVSPAATAGLQAGDWILSVEGQKVSSGAALASLLSSEGVKTVEIMRGSTGMSLTILPAKSLEGAYRLGAWVRDSTAGVGTLSFLDASSGWFAALGHPVSDIDTQETLLVRTGALVPAQIVDVIRGYEGTPGELMGVFGASGISLGTIRVNTDFGIFGEASFTRPKDTETLVPMGYAHEARIGEATMLSTISDRGVEAFSCEIIRVSTQDAPSTKGMVVEVTDPRLLEATGGIVQGMSGSPILQNGKLIGVITHVFVNDPTRGYCVFSEWMHEMMTEATG